MAHPSFLSLVRIIVQELNYAENTLVRIGAGHRGRRPKSTLFQLLEVD